MIPVNEFLTFVKDFDFILPDSLYSYVFSLQNQ